ncbi:MAG: GerAB/ArcD/ProY family transporter [Clostridia bacterium]|nr:GerAB/ArcD/ProY family transporter [Clostridia bacterium]
MNATITYPAAPNKNQTVLPRQIAFAAAFLLPVGKFLETPSILARYAGNDILLPALIRFLAESLLLLAVLYAATRSNQTLCERLENALGKGVLWIYIPFTAYYLLAGVLPLLDLEKFIYASFYDTAPTAFSFAAFFLFSAYFCTKGIKTLGRFSDLCLLLFLLPFIALIILSFSEADFTHLLPFFNTDFRQSAEAIRYATPHFSDVALLLPLLANCKFEKSETGKDAKKIFIGYAVGALFSLLLFAVFYAVYSSIAPNEHYAFAKIAQYFSALDVLGRIDLLLVYLLTVILFVYTCLPFQYATGLFAKTLGVTRRTWISAILNLALFFFTLYFNRYYNTIYTLISNRLAPVFWLFADILPLFLLLLPLKKTTKRKESSHA